IATLEQEIDSRLQQMPPFAEAVIRLDTIPGVGRHTAVLIVAEIGVDMSRFPSDAHLTAWAGMAPGNNQTGGKQRPTKSRKGNRYLRRGLTQAARAAARTKESYMRAMYHRLAARRGKNRAAVAVGRTILQIAYHLIKRGESYRDLGSDYFDRLDRDRTTKRLVDRLSALGFDVDLKERTLPAAA
ncbi:MAG TPA: transposase, partial [Ardenticatenaceae bacterium]|nr:transposase [Ardenticatenaceae bacterium]